MRISTIALITLALAAGGSTAFAQTNVWRDNFDDNILTGWTYAGRGWITEVNRQFVASGNFGPMQPNNPIATHDGGIHPIPTSGPLADNQTLELRADLVGASQHDAWAGVHFLWKPEVQGYGFFMDQDEVVLMKFWNLARSFAFFFYENLPLKNQNVTMVLALTRRGSDVEITTRVLDKDNANAVLFTRTVTDTPQADPVLPSGAVRGMVGMADSPGTAWTVAKAPTDVELTLTWADSQAAPQAPAQVTFDNSEVWQYESPILRVVPQTAEQIRRDGFRFTLLGTPNVTYRIERSSNLLNWTLLYTVSDPTGIIACLDDSAPESPRFYRMVRQ